MISLPQDMQAEAYDYPAAFFAPRVWEIGGRRRSRPRSRRSSSSSRRRAPLIIAGGGVQLLRGLGPSWRRSPSTLGIPVGETFAGKGAFQRHTWGARRRRPRGQPGGRRRWPRGRPGDLRRHPADRLHDRLAVDLPATPRCASRPSTSTRRDAHRLGATPVVADAPRLWRHWHRRGRGAGGLRARRERPREEEVGRAGHRCAPRRWWPEVVAGQR